MQYRAFSRTADAPAGIGPKFFAALQCGWWLSGLASYVVRCAHGAQVAGELGGLRSVVALRSAL